VVKPLFGSEGRGLVRVSDPELAWRTFRTLERLNAVLYVQRYVRNPGHDVRAFVLGRRLLGAMRRYAAVGEWRTNVAVGGQPEACTLDDEAERLALRSASAIGASMAGVDLLPDLETGRWTVLEVNAVPGWKALGAATGVDVASAILAELRDASR
jgi:ribosomal protein S6--L-glutamate ligase